MKRVVVKTILAVILLLGTATLVLAERKVIDRIVAVVEDEAIFQSDIDDVVKQIVLSTGRARPEASELATLRRQALENLINDMLVVAQASRLDVEITFSDVEEKVKEAIEENSRMLGGQEAFERQLEREGFTMESLKQLYRRQIRNRMLVERVLQIDMARNQREPTEEELRSFYNVHLDDMPSRPVVVHLKTIFIDFDKASSGGQAARAKIEEIHARALQGELFADLAKQYSEDPSGPQGGDIGFVRPDDLADPVFRAAVVDLGIGEISDPVQTAYGWHIIQVNERNPENETVRISHVLVRSQPTDADIAELFETANSIHRDIQAGADFDSLANRYSSDPNAGPGGDLGWLKLGDLPEFFQSVLGGMNSGDTSQVLRESSGFRIVKLVERETERRYDYDEIRGQLSQLWKQDQMSVDYNDYIASLKEKFTVDMKIDAN